MNPILEQLGIFAHMLASRGLSEHEEASRLELVQVDEDGREHYLVPAAAAAWRQLKAQAEGEGIGLFIVSAFRSVSRQAEIVRRKLEAGMEIQEILRACAPPGYSEHHTGRAVDVCTPGGPLLETGFEQTDAFRWLRANAHLFGFHLSYPAGNKSGYEYEPWHWCFHEDPLYAAPERMRL